MLSRITDAGRMIKFSHSVFALPFALIGLFLASHSIGRKFPPAFLFALWLVCMIAARASAMAFNRIADYKLDCINPRTLDRELPTGKLTLSFAKWFLAACTTIFVLAAAGFLAIYK